MTWPRQMPRIPVARDLSWRDRANCLGLDPDLFFPEQGASTRAAKEVCAGCVSREPCLQYALDENIEFGLWGGKSRRERKTMRRERQAKGAA
jgi:WhiB family transcriptional regulator, redox-sensing transcriptional regulator